MESPILKFASTWDWAVIHLVLVSLFATVMMISLFILDHRLQRLKKRKALDLEGGQCDIALSNKLRNLHDTDRQKPFNEKTFQSFIDLTTGRNPTFNTVCSCHDSTAERDNLAQVLANFLYVDGSKEEHEEHHRAIVLEPQSQYADQHSHFSAASCMRDRADGDSEGTTSQDSTFESPSTSASVKYNTNCFGYSDQNIFEMLEAYNEIAQGTADKQNWDAPATEHHFDRLSSSRYLQPSFAASYAWPTQVRWSASTSAPRSSPAPSTCHANLCRDEDPQEAPLHPAIVPATSAQTLAPQDVRDIYRTIEDQAVWNTISPFCNLADDKGWDFLQVPEYSSPPVPIPDYFAGWPETETETDAGEAGESQNSPTTRDSHNNNGVGAWDGWMDSWSAPSTSYDDPTSGW